MQDLGLWEWAIMLICCSVPIVIGVIALVLALVLGRQKR